MRGYGEIIEPGFGAHLQSRLGRINAPLGYKQFNKGNPGLVYFPPGFNPWDNDGWVPQLAGQLSIDYQRGRASIYRTHKVFYNKPLENTLFNRSALMRYGK